MYTQEDENKFLLSEFEQGMSPYSDKRIALYGTGINAKYIIENNKKFNIVALLDAVKEGSILFGLPVISADEAIAVVDIVVIVARAKVVPLIYERIKHFDQFGIDILLVNGNKCREKPFNPNNPYYKLCYKDLITAIDNHDAISFDIFDTLVCRCCQSPNDVAELAHISGIDSFEMEKRLLVSRKIVHDALRYAVNAGKTVNLISDMYYSKKKLTELLIHADVNLDGVKDIIVSCDVGVAKWPDGALFNYYKKLFPKGTKFLHIGDNPEADISCAEQVGLDTFYIMSTYEMVAQSHLNKLLVNVRTLGDKVVFGLIVSKILNDPFRLCANKGRIYFDDIYQMTYATCAPLAMVYNFYLINKYGGKQCHVLFFGARDGYPICNLYKQMLIDLNIEHCPKGHYVLLSRLCLMVASIIDENDLRFILNRYSLDSGTKRDLLFKYFLTTTEDNDSESLILGSAEMETFVMSYKKRIFEIAKEARQEFLNYVKKFVSDEDTIILFDFQSNGTIPYFLKKLLRNTIYSEVVCATQVAGYSLFSENDHTSYCSDRKAYLNESPLLHAMVSQERNFVECIFSSHDGSFLTFKDGKAYFSGKNTLQNNRYLMEQAHSAFSVFWNDFLHVTRNPKKHNFTPSFIEDLFHIISDDCCVCSFEIETMKNVSHAYGDEIYSKDSPI